MDKMTPKSRTTISTLLGDQKAILQRLYSIERTVNSIGDQLDGVAPRGGKACDESVCKINSIVEDFESQNNSIYSQLSNIESELSRICTAIGEAYNRDEDPVALP